MVASRQVSFAAQALFILATALAKISILASYLRLASQGTWFRRLSSKSYYPACNLSEVQTVANTLSSRWNLDYSTS